VIGFMYHTQQTQRLYPLIPVALGVEVNRSRESYVTYPTVLHFFCALIILPSHFRTQSVQELARLHGVSAASRLVKTLFPACREADKWEAHKPSATL
jgi:uncharacterized membrane protein YjjP (DUF1212 family)